MLRRHYPQFIEVMRFQITSRREFERLRARDPAMLTALERAARFSLSKLEPLLDTAHERLEGVVFENLDWKDVIRRYVSPGTLFYLDPPYWGDENDYGKGMFGRDQLAAIAEALGNIEGTFILSINGRSEIRELFGAFHMEEVALKYTVAKSEATGGGN